MCLAASAAVLWGVQVHRATPLYALVAGRGVGQVASGAAGSPGRPWVAEPVACRCGLGACAGEKWGGHTGPGPVDRGKPGAKMHILSDAAGLPIGVGVAAGNVHDLHGLKPMVAGSQMKHDPEQGRYPPDRQAPCGQGL
ncbi:transposase [Actinomadura rudentiformis]|uniref:transposase n=1 Tax=Actinomadura rudentiformis TaxID=359158 RepID=UPI00384F1137